MRTYSTIIGLLFAAVLPLSAQDWTPQDSLRLRRLLDGEGELKLNPKALKELEQEPYMGKLRMSEEKQWMDFN
ncbi:MAG: DUF4858 domain-containing protein, partial [Bacteroides sp.]|nr:DUF4858 domain-containing protein [Bacteroides sp.]